MNRRHRPLGIGRIAEKREGGGKVEVKGSHTTSEEPKFQTDVEIRYSFRRIVRKCKIRLSRCVVFLVGLWIALEAVSRVSDIVHLELL